MGLDILGLDDQHRAVYEYLIANPGSTVTSVENATGLGRAAVRRAVGSLVRLGLAAPDGLTRGAYSPAPPEMALGALILQHEDRLRQAESEMLVLGQHYREAQTRHIDLVDVVRGADAVRQRFNQLQRGARQEVRMFIRDEVVAVSTEENVEEPEAIGRGVHYRFVLERARLEAPGILDGVRSALAEGMQVRVAASLPIRMLVVDDEVAMIPLLAAGLDQSGGALLLKAGGLLDMAVSLFERTWHSAVPLSLGAGDTVSEQVLGADERELLMLLSAGLTDRAIGKRLGVSQRTVQRRVQELMVHAQAESRLQLGVAAVQRGWLPS